MAAKNPIWLQKCSRSKSEIANFSHFWRNQTDWNFTVTKKEWSGEI